MTWHSFDEAIPEENQVIVVASEEGARQFWSWNGSAPENKELVKMGFVWWLPLPTIPKPKDPFDEYWEREASSKLFSGTFPGTAKDAARIIYNAGRAYERSLK